MTNPIVVLTTDFGLCDNFVAVMKAVLLSQCNEAKIIDLTHEVPPHNFRHAAYNLLTSFKYFPEGTIFMTIVDPGVGTGRKAILVKADGRYFIAPDNGVLTYILDVSEKVECVNLDNKKYHLPKISRTFHGRDIFAPIAGHLARGVNPLEFGTKIRADELVRLPTPVCEKRDGIWYLEVLNIDHFGNLVTSLNFYDLLPEKAENIFSRKSTICISGQEIDGIKPTYASVADEETVAYIGSNGFLEIAVRNGNAKEKFGADYGTELSVVIE